jgi:hypothetical protein
MVNPRPSGSTPKLGRNGWREFEKGEAALGYMRVNLPALTLNPVLEERPKPAFGDRLPIDRGR